MEQARKETDRKPVEVWEDVEQEPVEIMSMNQPRQFVVLVVVAADRVVMDWEEGKSVVVAPTVAAKAIDKRFLVTLNLTNMTSRGRGFCDPGYFN